MLRSLAVRMALHRIAALTAVACAVFGGAAIVTGTGVLAESGLRSHLPAGRFGGADLLVGADQTLHQADDLSVALPERAPVPAALVARLAALPDVTAAVGDVSFPAAAAPADGATASAGDPGTAGHGWSSVRLLPGPRVTGRAPQGSREVAVGSGIARTAHLAPGSTARFVLAGRTAVYRVTAVVHPADAGVLVDDRTAARLAGRAAGAAVDLVGLRVRPGTEGRVADAVRAAVAGRGLVVTTGDARGDVAAPGASAARDLLVALASSLGGVPLLVVGLVLVDALGVTVAGQRRELALLRAVGATPRQVRSLVAGQATLIGALALLPGVVLGYVLADRMRELLVAIGLLPAALPLAYSALPALAAALLLGLIVQLAARTAARRVSVQPVGDALGESRLGPKRPSPARTLTGALVLASAIPLAGTPLLVHTAIGASSTALAGIVAAIGLVLVGPALLQRVTAGLARLLPVGASASSWLAVATLRGYALRSAGAVTSLAVVVIVALTYTMAGTTQQAAASAQTREGTLASVRLTAPGLGGIPSGLAARVAAAPGVLAVAPVGGTTVVWTDRTFGEADQEAQAAAVLTPSAAGVLDLGVRSGSLEALTGRSIAIGTDVASAGGLAVGSAVRLRLGDGTPARVRVAAVYDRDLGFGPLVVARDLVAGHTAGLDPALLVRTDGSAAAQRALARLAAAQPGAVLGAAVPSGGAAVPPEVPLNLAVIAVLLGYLLLGVVNGLVAATAARRGELNALRLTGATPEQLRRMVRWEAAILGGVAVTAGLLIALVPLALSGIGFLGRPWPAGPWWLLPAVVLTTLVVTFATAELPTRRALRSSPVASLATAG